MVRYGHFPVAQNIIFFYSTTTRCTCTGSGPARTHGTHRAMHRHDHYTSTREKTTMSSNSANGKADAVVETVKLLPILIIPGLLLKLFMFRGLEKSFWESSLVIRHRSFLKNANCFPLFQVLCQADWRLNSLCCVESGKDNDCGSTWHR